MSRTEDIYKPALSKRKVPILTLDNNWHKLFTQTNATPEIKKLEKKLNELLKERARVNEEERKLKAVRRKLMDEIIQLADRYNDRDDAVQKAMDRQRDMVEECSRRIKNLAEENADLPGEIEDANYELMVKTMEVCYKRLEENREEIEYYEKWIQDVREQLRENIIRKQDRETSTYELYTYMHNIFGRDVIDIFDMHYNPEKYKPKKKSDGYIE